MRNRKKVTFTLSGKVIEELKSTSDKTMIPQARLVESALKDLFKEKPSNMCCLERRE